MMPLIVRRLGIAVIGLTAGLLVGSLLVTNVRADGKEAGGPGDPLHPRVKIATSAGDFVVELTLTQTPITVVNFLDYAEAGFYNGTLIHRVKPGGLIQGGAYTAEMDKKTVGLRPPIYCESSRGLRNVGGTIAMVREVGKIDSAAAQFFVNISDNTYFNSLRDGEGYTVFGKVVDGMDVVERIAQSPTGPNPKYAAGYSAVVPRTPIVIKSVKITSPFDRAKAQILVEEARKRITRSRAYDAMSDEERVAMVVAEAERKSGGTFVKTKSGVRYLDLRIGNGLEPTIEDTVEVQYKVTLLDGSMIENTYAGAPRKRELQRFVPGLEEGMQTMKEGGERMFILPPELAYGAGGQPGIIPPNAWLVFDIELLSIE